MIGRKVEKERLLRAKESEYSEFVAVYGRRRVGKTFLRSPDKVNATIGRLNATSSQVVH